MASATAGHADELNPDPSDHAELSTKTSIHRRLIAVLVALLALALILAVVVLLQFVGARNADAEDKNRATAQGVAEQFALRMDTFDPRRIDAMSPTILPLLTTKLQSQFNTQLAQMKQLYTQLKGTPTPSPSPGVKASPSATPSPVATGTIRYAGVSDIDADSATVLVAHDSLIAASGNVINARWTVSLRKISGKWLVDDWNVVN